MKILLLGSGGREAALAWKISQSPSTSELYIAPGNAGTSIYGTNIDLNPLDFDSVKEFAITNSIDLVFPGGELPLINGITDFLSESGIKVFGPSKKGAMLEGSKVYAKEFMDRYGIPTASWRVFYKKTQDEAKEYLSTLDAPYVLKADGPAGGKGVVISQSIEDALQTLSAMLGGMFGPSSERVVIEQYLQGRECSVFVITDGTGNYKLLPVAKDYKRLLEGDLGPNTGGMGAVSPVEYADEKFLRLVEERIIRPTLAGLLTENIDYRGIIYFGLMNVGGNPYVVEYNVRPGDPETQAIMLRIKNDIVPLLASAASGNLEQIDINIDKRHASVVVLASDGYPASPKKPGQEITVSPLEKDIHIFHAATQFSAEGKPVTAGGRILTVAALGENLKAAVDNSYSGVDRVNFEGKIYRKDIGADFLNYKKSES